MRIFCFALLLIMSGCAVSAVPGSYDDLSTAPGYTHQVQALAEAVADNLERSYQGRGIALVQSESGMFGDALSYALQSRSLANPQGVELHYSLGNMDGMGFLAVQLADGTAFSQSFSLMYELPPASGLSSGFALISEPILPPVEEVPTGQQQSILRLAVLKSLPSGWRYTIPDTSKREVSVSWPVELDAQNRWRDRISYQADQAGCEARFDDVARRVTVATLPETSRSASTAVPSATPSVAPASPAVTQALNEVALPAATALPVSPAPVPSLHSPVLSMEVFSAPVSSTVWTIKPGSLHDQLQAWAEQAGYQFIWKANVDLDMEVLANFPGSFEEAVNKLFMGLHRSNRQPLRATLFKANQVFEVSDD